MVEELTIYGLALVPLIMSMIELVKVVGVPKRYSPLVALILGILFSFYYLAPGDPPKAVFLGIVIGLSSVGLYSGTKNTMQQVLNNENENDNNNSRGKNNKAQKVNSLGKNNRKP
jgi:hypothetical protein